MRRWKTNLAAVATSIFLLAFGGQTLAAPDDLDDLDVTLAVENQLLLEPGVASHNIDVSTEEGVVILSGSVDTYGAMLDAQTAAESVLGVVAVINDLDVKPRRLSDLVIRTRVSSALALNPVTESYEIHVEVVDGHVTLTGEVDSRSEKMAAEDVAAGVKGVVRVSNLLSYVFVNDRLDTQIQADIRYRLKSDASINSARITVAVDQGKVTLGGSVRSAAEKSEAETETWFVPGVQSVVNDMQVAWWSNEDATEPRDAWTDADAKQMVETAFLTNPWVNAFDIATQVHNGVATLTGTVDNLQAKRKAEEEARDTVGIRRVKNFLRVRPALPRTDAEIAKDIREALEQDPHVDRYDITVSVFSGKAYLRGEVDSVYMRQQAAKAAARVPGVVDIRNALDVDYQYTSKSDQEIKEDIESELFWSPFVDSDDIAVEVHSGVATLKGSVEDWNEARTARENAREGGATSVISMLDIANQSATD